MSLKELRDKRGKVVADMRAMNDAAENEERSFSDEEEVRYTKLFDEQTKLGEGIKREENLKEAERQVAERAGEEAEKEQRKERDEGGNEDRATAMTAFARYLRTGSGVGDGMEELRALSADNDTEGGFLVAPQQFVNQLIKFVDDMVFIRGKATVIQVPKAESLGIPSLDTDPADADWTAEIATGSEDSDMAFGKRELSPHPLAKRIKVSQKLLRVSVLPVENIVSQRLAYKFGITEEKAFQTGSGSNQPLGLFSASADGISTARDVSTGNTTTEIRFDGLIEAKYSLKGQYWNSADWLFHRDGIKQISKLKDGEGQYIWRESVRDGEPDRILGRPVSMSEYTPNTFTTGLYVGMLGDFSNYWIADALNMQVQRLIELYAETNQVGFIGRLESDGMPVLEEAFARVKLA